MLTKGRRDRVVKAWSMRVGGGGMGHRINTPDPNCTPSGGFGRLNRGERGLLKGYQPHNKIQTNDILERHTSHSQDSR